MNPAYQLIQNTLIWVTVLQLKMYHGICKQGYAINEKVITNWWRID